MRKQGMFLGMPYNFNKPNLQRFKERVWNKKDHALFVPKIFGWGYTINLHELFYRLRGIAKLLKIS